MSYRYENAEVFLSISDITVKDLVFPRSSIDTTAKLLYPDEHVPQQISIMSLGNGNCFFNSVSILLTGKDECATEIRARCALELARN